VGVKYAIIMMGITEESMRIGLLWITFILVTTPGAARRMVRGYWPAGNVIMRGKRRRPKRNLWNDYMNYPVGMEETWKETAQLRKWMARKNK
jgi:hypothetical protein